MDVILGIDGGGTGCRALAADGHGRVLGRGASGPANIMTDPEGARASILAAAAAALGGRDPARVTACLGLAGANMSGAREWLVPHLPFGASRVVHDAVTSVTGALGPGDGIVAAIGTGSVFARQLDREIVTLGGWGMVLGDEASGAWLGKRFLAQALRAGDGLAPRGPLAERVVTEMGGPAAVVAFAQDATAAEFAALVPRLMAAPDEPLAEALLAEGAAHVIEAVEHLRGGRDLPVVFLGGLGPVYAARMPRVWEMREPLGSALDGALQLAADLARGVMP